MRQRRQRRNGEKKKRVPRTPAVAKHRARGTLHSPPRDRTRMGLWSTWCSPQKSINTLRYRGGFIEKNNTIRLIIAKRAGHVVVAIRPPQNLDDPAPAPTTIARIRGAHASAGRNPRRAPHIHIKTRTPARCVVVQPPSLGDDDRACLGPWPGARQPPRVGGVFGEPAAAERTAGPTYAFL